jgi:cell division transport system permease protein
MKAWLGQHRRALASALERLARAPLATLLSALAVGIALALPAAAELLVSELRGLGRDFSARPQISIFLALDSGRQDLAQTAERLRSHAGVASIRIVGREETLERFRRNESLGDVVAGLERNPFPDAFVVSPRAESPAELETLKAQIAAWPKVEHVQLDSAWVRRADALLRFARLAVLLFGGLLGVALIALTFNTIRLQILTRSDEIEVGRLLGATDAWIRRPYLYFGALQGLLGGAVAWLVVFGAARLLSPPLTEVAASYGMNFALGTLGALQTAILLGFAASLGWIGARLSVARHLRSIEPR